MSSLPITSRELLDELEELADKVYRLSWDELEHEIRVIASRINRRGLIGEPGKETQGADDLIAECELLREQRDKWIRIATERRVEIKRLEAAETDRLREAGEDEG